MNITERISREKIRAQEAQALAFARGVALDSAREQIEILTALEPDRYWNLWADSDGVYFGDSFYAQESIMFDSPIAALLERCEEVTGASFTSSVDEQGEIEYRAKTAWGRIVFTVHLGEAGQCRRVVAGYRTEKVYQSVAVEAAVPIYKIVCNGSEATAGELEGVQS